MNAISPVPEDEEIFYKQSYLQKYLNLSAKERLYLEKNVEIYQAIDELTGLIASNKRPPEVEKAIYSCAAEVIFLIDKEPTYLIIAKMLMHFSETVLKKIMILARYFGEILSFSAKRDWWALY
ncbi:MAG: hypothetical protein EBZ47_06305 [Chlamydiae bacterium]|nr:hypothetical protein [Chlamydiota bacterium]